MKFTRYPKRDAIRDYFPLPNEIFSFGLSTGEIAVYAYLMYCEDRKTFQCHPSYKTIGNAVGMSKNTENNGGVNYYQNSEDGMKEIIREAMRQSGNIPPTLTKNQGERIGIFVARDVDFSSVYQLKTINR